MSDGANKIKQDHKAQVCSLLPSRGRVRETEALPESVILWQRAGCASALNGRNRCLPTTGSASCSAIVLRYGTALTTQTERTLT